MFKFPAAGQSSYNTPRKPPVSASRRRRLLFSYLPDWIITIVLAALFFVLEKIHGFRRSFSLEDTSLRHTYAVHERVPNWALVVICFVVPICLQPIINVLSIRSWWDLHNSSLGLVLSLALTGAVTNSVKVAVGRPRPDIIDRCQPPDNATDPVFGLSEWTICTQTDDAILKDGFRSFPSGHSSLSFAGLGFLAFYLAGKLHLFDTRGHTGKAWLALAPFVGAALTAISRTMDYRHHWHDVLTGSILGIVVSYFSYRQYYPHLASEFSHRPFSPRIAREDQEGILPLHHHRAPSVGGVPFNGPHDNNDQNSDETLQDNHLRTQQHNLRNDSLGRRSEFSTVERPNPGELEDIWRRGEEQDERFAKGLPSGFVNGPGSGHNPIPVGGNQGVVVDQQENVELSALSHPPPAARDTLR